MSKTFLFYDLETSGLDSKCDRIMQFAAQRTDSSFKPIGEPINELITLSDDILPNPDAVMITGITPQATIENGYKEAEFARILHDDIFVEDTIVVGYNNIRFDDEFLRNLFWRNFYDPYDWSWKDGRSRWDILDVVRMTRALRPDGIIWPVTSDGKATNRLELLTKSNNINHYKAHDAMSDVMALISVTSLIKDHQPQLFEYLFKLRNKKEVKKLINVDDRAPFVYTCGVYPSKYNKTTIALPLTIGRNGNIVVYDLRYDPSDFIKMNYEEIKKSMKDSANRLPIKELSYNKAPAVAPVSVLGAKSGWKKLELDEEAVYKNADLLIRHPEFSENVRSVFEDITYDSSELESESRLYDGFTNDHDKIKIELVRNAKESELVDLHPDFDDERLDDLLLHYKGRNYPKTLSQEEYESWEVWRANHINKMFPAFSNSLTRLLSSDVNSEKSYLLQELQLWAESLLPIE
jgi:exodeoxyribonuclease-1